MKQIKSTYTGIDIFSGAGGMSIGAKWAGIDVKIAVENDIHAAKTFAFNHPETEVWIEDIKNTSTKDLKKLNPFVLFGGPPCQGFSQSNTKTRSDHNPNNSLFEQYLRYVEELAPNWIVFENVQGFQTFQKGRVVLELEKRLSAMGYITKKTVLWASHYGVPQNRNRFFLVGNKMGLEYKFPEPLPYSVTVSEALSDLPILQNGDSHLELPYKHSNLNEYTKFVRGNSLTSMQNLVSKNQDYVIERYKHIKPGENWKSIPIDLMSNYNEVNNTHSGIYKRLDPDQPSVVISNYRKNMLIHPHEHRGLSVREAARLQSFPDNFIFKGSLTYIQQQIGNAVPPLLAYAIFKSILEQAK